MSINRKRSNVDYETNRRAYNILTTIDQDPYPFSDEMWAKHNTRTRYTVYGSKNDSCWKRKVIFKFQYRMYRTWKHNRKTQWKN